MQILFWPCMIASLILAILALSLKRAKLLFISTILNLPMSLYLAATPRFHLWGLIFPLLYAGAAVTLKRKKLGLAALLIVPNFVLICWLGYSVLNH
ncbi:hypothetical protein [Neobacillus mesonae]|uniref:hypothetical protein n=1 Tax=Neobacillus mesonae TaxID=1193713 RepID=UPI002040176F|nr:hypothetical protein [Neobacillus mesonae]MCM3569148.1 hypothetical protein [Neobacillus mesonae]